jgi:hypothetical protein
MDEQEKKKVDESYKAHVEEEKEAKDQAPDEELGSPQANFPFFITTLGMQAAIALGDALNPQNNKKEENLPQAKFLIDTLGLLQEKTKNNLTKDENDLLENMLYELRLRYVQKSAGMK